MALGAYDNGVGPQFNMTALAIRSAGSTNAVSQLHGEVTRAMFAPMWPDVPEASRPVTAVTNGVHVPTWIAGELSSLFSQYLGQDWLDRHDDPASLGRRARDPGRRALACALVAPAVSVRLRPRAGAQALDGGTRRHPRASSPPERCSIRTS